MSWSTTSTSSIYSDVLRINSNEFQKQFISTWDTISEKGIKEEKENMENLYQVYMVNKYRSILIEKAVVAKNEEEAKFKVCVYEFLTMNGMGLSDVTVIVKSLGSVVVEDIEVK